MITMTTLIVTVNISLIYSQDSSNYTILLTREGMRRYNYFRRYLLTALARVKTGRYNMELEPIIRGSHRPRSYSTGTLSLSKHPSTNRRII